AVPDEPAEPVDRLIAALSDRQALLVLDNCEHLIAAAAALADKILRASPRVRILATSREPLGITGEALWPGEPLALPPAGAGAGGATTDAAEQVCAGGAVPPEAVPDLLASLVEKSLLVVRDSGGTPRYRMLETIKAYGQERLDEAGEREQLRAAHARYFLELAENAYAYLFEARQLHWLDL